MKNIDKKIKKALKESIKHVLKEGFNDDNLINKWENIVNELGADTVLEEVFKYFGDIELIDFMKSIDGDYNLGLFDDEYNNDEEDIEL
jgi:hypothetical protein